MVHSQFVITRAPAPTHKVLARLVGTRAACPDDHDDIHSAESTVSAQLKFSNTLSCNMGPCVCMSSWTSLLAAMAHYHSSWASWKQLITRLQEQMLAATHGNADQWPHADDTANVDGGAGVEGLPVNQQGAPGHGVACAKIGTPTDTATDDHAPAGTSDATPLRINEASAARTMSLAPSLFTFRNFVNVHIMLIVKQALVSRQSKFDCGKTTVKHQPDAIMLAWSKGYCRVAHHCYRGVVLFTLSPHCNVRLELAAALAGERDRVFLAAPTP